MSGQLLIPLIVIAALLVAVSIFSAFFTGGGAVTYPYEACDSLLSPAERSFYGVLRQALDPSLALFAKVRLADIVRLQRGVSGARRAAPFNRIKAKHVDFVICDASTFKFMGVIELDDKSHREDQRRRRDEFVDATLAAARIPVLHVPAQRAYSLTELRAQLHSLLHAQTPAGNPPTA